MKIHQALHGLEDGRFKMLACSIEDLYYRDRVKMEKLGAWDGYAGVGDDNSYITMYELGGYYVIAKTWCDSSAEESQQIWTHSLFVDLDAVQYQYNLEWLYDCFIKPAGEDYESYSQPIDVSLEVEDDKDGEKEDATQYKMPALSYWLEKMLHKEGPLSFAVENTSEYYQKFLLRLQNYLPFGLMKQYALCSGTASIREYNRSKDFDLQFIVDDKGELPKLSEPVDGYTEKENWLKWLSDSIKGGWKFMSLIAQKYDEDISIFTSRYAVVITIINTVMDLEGDVRPGKKNVSTFESVLKLMASTFRGQLDAQFFKKSMLSEKITCRYFDEREFIYQMATTPYWKSFNYVDFDFFNRTVKYLQEILTTKEAREILMKDLRKMKRKTNNPYIDVVIAMDKTIE